MKGWANPTHNEQHSDIMKIEKWPCYFPCQNGTKKQTSQIHFMGRYEKVKCCATNPARDNVKEEMSLSRRPQRSVSCKMLIRSHRRHLSRSISVAGRSKVCDLASFNLIHLGSKNITTTHEGGLATGEYKHNCASGATSTQPAFRAKTFLTTAPAGTKPKTMDDLTVNSRHLLVAAKTLASPHAWCQQRNCYHHDR